MSSIKEVKVALNPIDEKALSRTTTRRRRTTRKAADEQEGGAEPMPMVQKETSPIPAAQAPAPPTPAPQAPAPPTPAPQAPAPPTPAPQAPATSMGGGGQKVKIAAKKGGQTLKAPPSATASAKLLPKKRISSAPAATLKKPRIPIRPAPEIAISQKRGGAILNVPTKPSVPIEPPKPALAGTTAVGGATPTAQKKRRFTERKISIDMKQAATTRKQRKFVKSKIANMPIATVKKMLIRKGLLKSKATAPPEAIMRGLLKDYYLLHAAE
jgi:hypothetical protein